MFYKTIVFIFSLIVVVVHGFNNIDYCQLGCNIQNNPVKHVVCDREADNCGPHQRCRNFVQVNVTKRIQDFIVNEHNKYRNKVALGLERRGTDGSQPAASNMKAFRYNKELGYIAQCWANTCQIQKHSYCNKATNLPYVGQNMALRSYSWQGGVSDVEKNLKLMIAAWYDEVALFNYNFVKRFHFELSYGHYTQMIWGNTDEIGCGISSYTSEGWYHIFFVCDYGSRQVSGNVIDHEVYKVGKPCSQCPRGTVCNSKFKGLCSPPEKQGNNKLKNTNKDVINNHATPTINTNNDLANNSSSSSSSSSDILGILESIYQFFRDLKGYCMKFLSWIWILQGF